MNTLINTAASPFATPATPFSAELALTLLGPSTAMAQLWSQIRRLAPHMRTVLLTGEPDAGQEAVARLLLDLSPHPNRRFLLVPSEAAEDKLARALTPGGLPHEFFLFLPDADQLSAAAQASLLRLLRTKRPHAVSVAAAVTESLRTLVGMGRFSAELADLLGAVRIAVPALKQRAEDLPMLLNQMLSLQSQARQQTAPQVSEALLRAAMQHSWEGNLHELSEISEELLRQGQNRSSLDLPDWNRAVQAQRIPKVSPAASRLTRLDNVIQEHIYQVLRACGGNKQRAADILGISRSTLYRMLEAAAQNTPLPLAS